MRPDFNKRYTSIAVHCAVVIFLAIFAVFALMHFSFFWNTFRWLISILSPILIGAILAYLFSPIVTFFEKKIYCKLDEKKKYRLKRVLSVISSFLIILLFLFLLILYVIPAVLRGYEDLAIMSNMYLETLKEWLLEFSLGEGHALSGYFDTLIGYIATLLDDVYGLFSEILPDFANLMTAVVGILGDVILGIILSVYFLFSKEKILAQFKKLARAFLSRRKFSALLRSVKVTNEKFGGFLKGQFADALIIGVLAYICLAIIGVPYYPLVSVVIGIASFIPVFGMLIGSIIGAGIILLADPYSEPWFALFMVGLYLVNKFMINPRVIRITVDASSVFMLAAIIITTGLVGLWGLILGVPLFAVLYAFLHALINKRLAKRGLSTDAYEYYTTKTGKELYIEREVRKRHHGRLRGRPNESAEIFVSYDNESDDGELFTADGKEINASSDHEFPQ